MKNEVEFAVHVKAFELLGRSFSHYGELSVVECVRAVASPEAFNNFEDNPGFCP